MRSAIPGNHLKRRPCRKIKATPNPTTWMLFNLHERRHLWNPEIKEFQGLDITGICFIGVLANIFLYNPAGCL